MKLIKQVSIISAATVLGLSLSSVSYAKTYKLAHSLPKNNPVHKSLSWFAKQVSKRAHLRVKVFANGVLGSEDSVIQMVQSGTVAFQKVSTGPLESFSKIYKILSLPYLYRDFDHYHHVLQGPIGDKILASSTGDGFVGLAFLDAGARSFYSNKAIRTPADLQGMKIRTQPSPMAIAAMKALGATPVPLAMSELYSALQQGVVDGAENSIPSYYSARQYEVANTYSYDMHTMIPDVLIVSQEFWNSLSKKKQRLLRKIARETVAQQTKNWDNYVQFSLKKLKAKNIKFVKSDIPQFQKAVQPLYDKFKDENPDLVPLLKEIQNTK